MATAIKRRRLLALIVPTVAAISVLATTATGTAATPAPIVVGDDDALTGGTAFAGQTNVCGVRVAAAAINAGGGVLGGRKFKLVVTDDQTNPAIAAQNMQKLTAQGIRLFMGPALSTLLLAQIPVLNDADGITFGGTSKSDVVLTAAKHVLRLNSNTAQDAVPTASFINNVLKPKKLTIVVADNTLGHGTVGDFFPRLKSSISPTAIYVDPNATDYRSVLTTLQASRPDLVLVGVQGDQPFVTFVQQYAATGVSARLIAPAGGLVGGRVQQAGSAANGMLGADNWADTLRYAANLKMLQHFKKYGRQFSECSGKVVDKQFAMNYSSLLLLSQIVQKCKCTDPARIQQIGVAGKWSLPLGNVTFQQTGQANSRYVWLIAQNGKLKRYYVRPPKKK